MAKTAAKSVKKAPAMKGGKAPAKVAKASKKPASKISEAAPDQAALSAEELEEMEEEQEAAAHTKSSRSTSNNVGELSIEAAGKSTGTSEGSGNLKNFRHHPDMENFYRFIYENDLRFEALEIIDKILIEEQTKRKIKAEKARAN